MALSRTPFANRRYDLLTIQIPAPGVGNHVHWVIPANTVVQIVGFSVALTTSAVAGNRYVNCWVDNVALLDSLYTHAHFPHVPSLTLTYYFSVGLAPLDLTAAPIQLQQNPLACSYQMKTGEMFVVAAVNWDAGDAFGVTNIRYMNWLEA